MMVAGKLVPIRVKLNRQARRLILKVDPMRGDIIVVTPTKTAARQALKFAEKERVWIENQLLQMPQRVQFEAGALFPLRGQETLICHEPSARRGVWHDAHECVLTTSGQPEFVARRVQDWLKREARRELVQRVETFAEVLGLQAPKVSVRDTSSRWGSCAPSGLNFTWRLIMAPPEILTYVVAHECAHLKHMNHSKAFWSVVGSLDADCKVHDKWLDAQGKNLHRYG